MCRPSSTWPPCGRPPPRRGSDPGRIDPLVPVDLVVDHSVQVDAFGSDLAYDRNIQREYERNSERYALLRWAQEAFGNFSVVPPGMGIVHQVNLEYLARVVVERDGVAFPDTLVGTDSHTTMINAPGRGRLRRGRDRGRGGHARPAHVHDLAGRDRHPHDRRAAHRA